MSAIQLDTRTDLDEILYQSVVDDEFRAQLLADPSLLGLGEQSVTLPAAIEPQNSSGLDLAAGRALQHPIRSDLQHRLHGHLYLRLMTPAVGDGRTQ